MSSELISSRRLLSNPARRTTQERLCQCGWAAIEFDEDLDLRLIIPLLRPQLANKLHLIVVDRLSPRLPKDARPDTMSSCYGAGAFPLHTDRAHWPVPPRYILLRSVGDESDRPTTLLDTIKITSKSLLREPLWYSKWLVESTRTTFMCTVMTKKEGDATPIFRYDTCCMRPFDSAASRLEEDITCELGLSSPELFGWVNGTVLIIDNWRALHGRGTSTTEDFGRVLERVVIP